MTKFDIALPACHGYNRDTQRVSTGDKMQDSSGFRLRVDGQLRQEFISACRAHDRAAAQVLREFMRDYVAKHYGGQQDSLFREESDIPSGQNL